ncbi:MAG: DMT family transporter [Candidatus Bathyarchaeota archaeon]|nr:MAG: DMT family transporter [Candidatus Bathyarchaeota archaeon]
MIGELAALGAALCWTVSAALYKVALVDAKPVSANLSRCISTTAFFVACLGVTGRLQYLATLRMDSLLLAGLSGAIGLCVGDTLYMLSLKLVGVSRAVPITCTYPLFTMLFASLFFGEQITLFVLLSAVLIVAGIWLISQETGKSVGMERNVLFKGIIVGFVTAVVWAVSITFMDEALMLSDLALLDAALVVNTVRLSATTLSLLAISPLFERKFGFLKLKRRTWVILALGGIVALGLGWVLLAVSLLDIPASHAVPISSVSPLFATMFGSFLLKERVTTRIFVGSVFIVLGTFVLFVV